MWEFFDDHKKDQCEVCENKEAKKLGFNKQLSDQTQNLNVMASTTTPYQEPVKTLVMFILEQPNLSKAATT